MRQHLGTVYLSTPTIRCTRSSVVVFSLVARPSLHAPRKIVTQVNARERFVQVLPNDIISAKFVQLIPHGPR